MRSLKNLSETRWACRADAITSINATLEAVIVSLEHIQESDAKPNIVAEAKGLLKSIDFKFILSLVVSTIYCKIINLNDSPLSYTIHIDRCIFQM